MKTKEKNPDFDVFWTEIKSAGSRPGADRYYAYYTPAFNAHLEAIINNPVFGLDQRVLAWLVLGSWGNWKSYVCRRKGTAEDAQYVPATQTDCARDLRVIEKKSGKVNVRPVNQVVLEYQRLGILQIKGNVIVLDPNPKIVGATPPADKRSTWEIFDEEVWTAEYPDQAKQLAELEAKAMPIRSLRMTAYRDWYRARKTPASDIPNATEPAEPEIRNAAESTPTEVRNATEKVSDTPRNVSDDLSINRARVLNLKKIAASSDGGDDPAAAAFVKPEQAAAAASPPHPTGPRSQEWLDRQAQHDAIAEEVLMSGSQPDIPAPDSITPILEAFKPVGGILHSKARWLMRNCPGATAVEIADKASELIPGILKNKTVHSAVAVLLGSQINIGELRRFFHSADDLKQWRREREETATNDAAAIRRAEESVRHYEQLEARQREVDARTDEKIAAMGPDSFERLVRSKLARAKKDYPSYTETALRAVAERAVRRDLEESDEKARGVS